MARVLKLILIKLLYFIKNFDKYCIILLRVFLRDVEKCQYSLQEIRRKSHNTLKISVVDYVHIFDTLVRDYQNILQIIKQKWYSISRRTPQSFPCKSPIQLAVLMKYLQANLSYSQNSSCNFVFRLEGARQEALTHKILGQLSRAVEVLATVSDVSDLHTSVQNGRLLVILDIARW